MTTITLKGARVAKGSNKGAGPGMARRGATVEKKSAGKKAVRLYPADDAPAAKVSRVQNKPKTRASLVPGTVLILLAGRFKGKRCILLKVLDSGLLLVTGPYKVNGVPAKRVNPAYVIATSTKVNVSVVDTSAFTDAYFTAPKAKKAGADSEFFKAAPEKKELPAAYKANQKKLDDSIKLAADMEGYLKDVFTLRSGDRPHLMKF